MNSMVEVKADYIVSECGKTGVEVNCEYRTEPLEFAIISNKQGDIGSISERDQLYEPARYLPSWSIYMKQWAKAEGFSENQIEEENLMREVTIQEMVGFFTKS